MWIKEVNFPSAVIEAQRSGRLVIFAGAGVSKDPPSDYPDFPGLAAEVGGPSHPKRDDEAIEVYLGRLVSNRIKVHDQVRRILSSPNSRPNANHYALIRLFKNRDCFRLITTNFDRHFSTATNEQLGDAGPEVFFAPALPIGSEFTGIINLHGSVDREPHRMVLTDSDFARAYINEGWATRFLERLFSHFVVLFVGYSHQDMLMTYLARGLTSGSPGPGRFALTPPDDDERWNNLGIVPVHYPRSEPPASRHARLTVAINAWAEQCEAGALAVENRIRTIVSGKGPAAPEEDDFLKDALSNISRLRFFTRHAHGPQWLLWAERQVSFQAIFATRSDYSGADEELASWFGREYMVQYPDEALDLIRRRGLGVSPLVWHNLCWALFRAKVDSKIDPQVLSKWVTLLVQTAVPAYRNEALEYILAHCKYPEDAVPALVLFEYLSRPRVLLKQSLKWFGDEGQPRETVDIEVDCGGSEHWLAKVWNDLFLPNLGDLAKRVGGIVSSHLNAARRLHVGFGKSAVFDRLSWSRGMIETRSQDHLRNGLSVLIDAGARVLEWSAEHDHNWLTALATDWFLSDSPLLRRLAIYGAAISSHVQGDEKISWIIKQRLVHEPGIKHELFLLLEKAYPHASPDVRMQLLKGIEERYDIRDEKAEAAAYEFFNIVNWLAKSDPECRLAATFLNKIKDAHPKFGERDHPDMDSWIGGVSAVNWNEASEDLTSCSLSQLIEKLNSAEDTLYPAGNTKDGIIHSIGQSAQKVHPWGLAIAREAKQASLWSNEVWQPLLGAWAATDLNQEEWREVLGIMEAAGPIYESTSYPLTWLLQKGIESSSGAIPLELIPRAKAVADIVWSNIDKAEQQAAVDEDTDWLGKAINHPAGQLFQFYFQCLARSRQGDAEPHYLLEDYKLVFSQALTGSSVAAQLARVILSSQVQFLFYLDAEWTVNNVFPVLNPKLDEQRARQCWNGFLYWGRWTDAMLESLMPCYEGMFALIDSEKDEIQRMFSGHLSGIAIYSSFHPLETGWLFRFLTSVKPETKSIWAWEFHSIEAGLDVNAKLNLWKRWLRQYWEARVLGQPVPLTGMEVAQMIEWALDLAPVFSEAVALIRRGPHPEFKHSMIYYRISESELLQDSPDCMVDLLAFLTAAAGPRPPDDLDRLYAAARQLVQLVPKNPGLRILCDSLASLGASGVSALAEKLDPPYNVT